MAVKYGPFLYLLRNLAYKLIGVLDRISHEVIFPFLIVGILMLLCGFGESLGISSALIAFMLGVIVPENSTSMTFGKEVGLALIISTYMASRLYGLSRKSSLRASLSFLSRGEFSVIFPVSFLLPKPSFF